MIRHRVVRAAALGLALAGFAAPVAAAQQDLRSPDARDAAPVVLRESRQDLRSADARDAAPVAHPRIAQDLRSPDARDAGRPQGTFNVPEVTVVRVPESATAATGGMDWGDAAIGAGFAVALGLIGVGGTLAVVRRTAASRRSVTSRIA